MICQGFQMRYQSVQVLGFAFLITFCLGLVSAQNLFGQESKNQKFSQEDKFRQLEEILPTPNRERAASESAGEAIIGSRRLIMRLIYV